ncbi:phenoloxidase-activating factor 3 isoform X3 [Culex quinquefasciatus]|uniref:phenoloxidase-activating factor 3 isoform X3 n=1 Tax=Culex quinquefasciatus TaxID=7176 RepID=UPI0018E2CB16|nr:phenoloxidase-activating factor 3 isoform X3 [Culex quinquefasciatus]
MFAANKLKVISTLSCGRRPGAFQRPWLAEVYFRKDSTWERPNIMGVILSPRYILTPAHEYSIYSEFGVRVLFGEINHPHSVEDSYFANRTYRDVINAESEVHENFKLGVRRFNLGLLRLDTDVEFTDRIQPICLPDVRPEPPERFTILPDVVNGSSTVTRVDFGRCSSEWRRYGFHDRPEFSESHACVKLEREHDDCYGIEGSPLLGRFEDHGVERFVQYGFKYFGDCTDGLQIYTNVSFHLEWILERIRV